MISLAKKLPSTFLSFRSDLLPEVAAPWHVTRDIARGKSHPGHLGLKIGEAGGKDNLDLDTWDSQSRAPGKSGASSESGDAR